MMVICAAYEHPIEKRAGYRNVKKIEEMQATAGDGRCDEAGFLIPGPLAGWLRGSQGAV